LKIKVKSKRIYRLPHPVYLSLLGTPTSVSTQHLAESIKSNQLTIMFDHRNVVVEQMLRTDTGTTASFASALRTNPPMYVDDLAIQGADFYETLLNHSIMS
jgi:hypothetical protein